MKRTGRRSSPSPRIMRRRRRGGGRAGRAKAPSGGLEDPVAKRIVGEAGDRLELPDQEFERGRVLLAVGGEADLAARAAAQIAALDEGADLAAGGLAVEPGGGGDRADVAPGGIAGRKRGRHAAQ